MSKIIFVTGAVGSGKSTYIRNHYQDQDGYFIFDMVQESIRLFCRPDALTEGDHVLDIYNSLSERGMFALLDGLQLVVEYCISGYDEGLMAILAQAKSAGLRTEWIHLDTELEIAKKRIEKAGKSYCSSENVQDETLEILEGVIETYLFNIDFEEICEVGTGSGCIKFFRKGCDGKNVYFFLSNETTLFDFEPKFEYEKFEGANYVEEFEDFQQALNSLLAKHDIFCLIPLKVNQNYKAKLKQTFKDYLKGGNSNAERSSKWLALLN
ncbi:DEAD/DEAH box helicase family protein [Pararhodonellum marinum]|uniref:AAA family ATPase n=1 Tax=Pararhodonellum marinum TaxID=2755358 RepID=UPI00188FA8A4|nr:AAA family ATPase [Pararhodonellum marinum]